ncbi:hypothetical protein REPUB_Repub07fG0075400 [Reevesia pubescens]
MAEAPLNSMGSALTHHIVGSSSLELKTHNFTEFLLHQTFSHKGFWDRPHLLFSSKILRQNRRAKLKENEEYIQNKKMEELLEEKKRVRNPLVPVGALITAGVLTAGLISFRQGNSRLGQRLMRARVVVQGATVALMVGTAYYYGDNPWKSS